MNTSRRVAFSASSALIAEVANKIFPLIVIVYAQSKLGVENFGIAQYSIYLAELFLPFVVWGYQYHGAIEVGQNQSNMELVSKFFSDVLILRLIHGMISVTALIVLTSLVGSYAAYKETVICLGLFFILSSFDAAYFLHGFQKVYVISVFSVLAKTLSLLGVFYFVRESGDFVSYAMLSFGVNSVISFATFVYILVCIKPQFLFSPKRLLGIFVKALPFAVSYYLLFIADRMDLFWIERFFDDRTVGAYAGALRLQQAIGTLIMGLGAVFFSEMVSEKAKDLTKLIKYELWIVLSLALPIAVGSCFVGLEILELLFGENFSDMGPVLSLLLLGNLAYIMIILFGQQILFVRGKVSDYISIFALFPLIVTIYFWIKPADMPSEVAGVITLFKFGVASIIFLRARRYISRFPFESIIGPVIASLLMAIVLYFIAPNASLLGSLVGGSLVYLIALAFISRKIIFGVIGKLRS